MPLSTAISRLRKCRHSLSPIPAVTGGSPPDKHLKPHSLPPASLYSRTLPNEQSVSLTSKTFEWSEEGSPKAHLSSDPSLETQTNSPRDFLSGSEKVASQEYTLLVHELEGRFARIVARPERNPKQPTHQHFTLALPNRIWGLIYELFCYQPPNDYSNTCDRPFEDSAVSQGAELVCSLAHHSCPDDNFETQDDSAGALSFYIAKSLGTLGVHLSPGIIESDQAQAIKLLREEIEKSSRESVNYLMINCNGPSGRRNDPKSMRRPTRIIKGRETSIQMLPRLSQEWAKMELHMPSQLGIAVALSNPGAIHDKSSTILCF